LTAQAWPTCAPDLSLDGAKRWPGCKESVRQPKVFLYLEIPNIIRAPEYCSQYDSMILLRSSRTNALYSVFTHTYSTFDFFLRGRLAYRNTDTQTVIKIGYRRRCVRAGRIQKFFRLRDQDWHGFSPIRGPPLFAERTSSAARRRPMSFGRPCRPRATAPLTGTQAGFKKWVETKKLLFFIWSIFEKMS
jgi:hypothetical protein